MKQSITKEQWKELSREQQEHLEHTVEFYTPSDGFINIGQMIEFLGDGLYSMEVTPTCVVYHGFGSTDGYPFEVEKPELCDVLWEACTHKLREE